MSSHSVTLSSLQNAALSRELEAFNAANIEKPLTLDGFVQALVSSRADAAVREHAIITPFAFVSRFSSSEYSKIMSAAKTSDEVAKYVQKLQAANEVDLTHDVVSEGLALLETAGLIATGRAAEIGAL